MTKTALFASCAAVGLAAAIGVAPGVSRADEASKSDDKANAVTEVIVTAQKREENVQHVPVAVSVLQADRLTDNNQVLIRDYYSSVPGLTIQSEIYSQVRITIRGLNNDHSGSPTVGVTVDGVPLGSAGFAAQWIPDLDPGELSRVEILRGPQGTLYGASSIGGLLNYVTKDPSTAGYNGRVEAGVSSVYNGRDPGYDFRASANIPISSDLAVRLSAYDREDPGYIDNPIYNKHDVNVTDNYGGRFSALWTPGVDTSLKFSATYQQTKQGAPDDVTVLPGFGPLAQNFLPGVRGLVQSVQAYSAIFKTKLGGVTLTSLTGYNHRDGTGSLDWTQTFGPLVNNAFGVKGASFFNHAITDRWTQEVRLSGAIGRVDWLSGLYYSGDRTTSPEHLDANNVATGQVAGRYLDYYTSDGTTEYAAFVDATYHVTDRFSIQLGARESHVEVEKGATSYIGAFDKDIFGVPSPVIQPGGKAKADAFTYLLTPTYQISPNMMLYIRLASGFRPGAVNSVPGTPPQAGPDKTNNYEAGLKADFLDHALTLDAAIFHIDWQSIQLSVNTTVTDLAYITNGGSAKSDGAEFSATLRPAAGLTITGAVSYDNAVLTQNFPANSANYGVKGNRLPGSTPWSADISVEQRFPLWNGAEGFVGAEVSYVGDRLSVFNPTPNRDVFPGYTKTDLRAGVNYKTWSANVYVNNLANVRGIVGGGSETIPSYAFTYIRPRLIGLNIAKTF